MTEDMAKVFFAKDKKTVESFERTGKGWTFFYQAMVNIETGDI